MARTSGRRSSSKSKSAAATLTSRWTFCIRKPNEHRMKRETYEGYKKGWEVRFSAASVKDRKEIQRRLIELGLKPGKPYRKSQTMWIVPVYGREAVEMFAS